MQKTVGSADRVLRMVVSGGAVIGSGVLGFSSGWGVALLAVAAVMGVTAATGYCPLYSVLGVRTAGADRDVERSDGTEGSALSQTA